MTPIDGGGAMLTDDEVGKLFKLLRAAWEINEDRKAVLKMELARPLLSDVIKHALEAQLREATEIYADAAALWKDFCGYHSNGQRKEAQA